MNNSLAVVDSKVVGLVIYDEMIRAIAVCHRTDEISSIRAKAKALEILAKQAKNIEAERQLAEIRIRAERRWGQMYREQEKATGNKNDGEFGGRNVLPPNNAPTLETLGVSKQQSASWQKLAEPSDKQFEKALNQASSMGVPTTSGVLRNTGATHEVSEVESDPKSAQALWVWGRVNQFAEHIEGLTPKQCAARFDETMRSDMKAALPDLISWLINLENEV
jgi:hypothetical protein